MSLAKEATATTRPSVMEHAVAGAGRGAIAGGLAGAGLGAYGVRKEKNMSLGEKAGWASIPVAPLMAAGSILGAGAGAARGLYRRRKFDKDQRGK